MIDVVDGISGDEDRRGHVVAHILIGLVEFAILSGYRRFNEESVGGKHFLLGGSERKILHAVHLQQVNGQGIIHTAETGGQADVQWFVSGKSGRIDGIPFHLQTLSS